MLTDAEIEGLGTRGFFTRAGFLGLELAEEMHAHAEAIACSGALAPAQVRRGADRRLDTDKRGDSTTWVPEDSPALQPLRAAFHSLGASLSAQAYLGLGHFDLQLARYPGAGTHYVRHRDAFPGPENRRITAIWYANPEWKPEHGGALRLYTEDSHLDVEPLLDQLVVFISDKLDHEVLPTHVPRLALTAWFYALR